VAHEVVLGRLIGKNQERDATHVPTVPVVAGEELEPGDHIAVDKARSFNELVAIKSDDSIGIVDPFYRGTIYQGQRFWMMLYPGSVVDLRHVYKHPVLDDVLVPDAVTSDNDQAKKESELWLRKFCETADCPNYDALVAAASGQVLEPYDSEYYDSAYRNDGEYLHFSGRDAHGEIPPEFWDHVSIVTGRRVPEGRRAPYFSCSC
jgi:hypothetical protein